MYWCSDVCSSDLVALVNPIFDKHIVPRGIAFVIDIERTAAFGNGAVVDDGHPFGGHALANTAREHAGPFSVEVPFQAMANRFMEQDPGPARTDHHRHFTRPGRPGFELGERLVHGSLYIAAPDLVGEIRDRKSVV